MGEEAGTSVDQSHVNTLPYNEQPNSHWKDAPNSECYSSFGDDGTTATVNAYGDIMQFSKYLGKGHSGMFSADHKCVPEPYQVEKRTAALQSLIGESSFKEETTYGAQSPELIFVCEPELSYVHNRWPRVDYVLAHDGEDKFWETYRKFNDLNDVRAYLRSESSGLSRFSTTSMVHGGIVFQRCVATNHSSDKQLEFNIQFAANMLIRDLDHLDPDYSSNKDDDENYFTFLGPESQSWVRLHQFPGQNPGRQENQEATKYSVAVIVSVFIYDEMQSWTRTATDPAPDNATVSDHSDTSNKINNAETIRAKWCSEDGQFMWSHTVAPGKEVEITFAYDMRSQQDSQTEEEFQRELKNSHGRVDKGIVESVRNILEGKPLEATFSLASLQPVSKKDVEVTEENTSPHRVFQTGDEMGETELNQPKNPDVQSESRIEDPSGEILDMSPRSHLEFFARRNLEHILSVCAIPIDSKDESFEKSKVPGKPAFQPIALTCGDMAFHRVNTSASFFAFEFLIETAKRLQRSSISNHKQAKSLLDRIQRVCIGHLLWLITIALKQGRPPKQVQPSEEDQQFVANYWVSGDKMIAPQDTQSWQPKDFLTDSAYQWIKIQECLNVFEDDLKGLEEDIFKVLEPIMTEWQKKLESLDTRDDCAWPQPSEDGVKKFRLRDHIWIWRGLRAIDNIKHLSQNLREKRTPSILRASWNKQSEPGEKRKIHDVKKVQQTVIRHFTTRNEVLAKRTLAVTRSSRETRFLFHARDTVLVYAKEWDFISDGDSNALEVWENAMLAQPEHEENQEFTWHNALHYGLSILMASKGFSIDKRKPSGIIKDSLATLTRSSSPNGLFPGRLDITTKQDDAFYQEADRDSYFHAGFEIPFILLTNTNEITAALEKKIALNQQSNDIDEKALDRTLGRMEQFIPQHTLKNGIESNIAYTRDDARTKNQTSRTRTLRMKKSMPVSLSIDADNVVDVDDEWLYERPGFLTSKMAAEKSFVCKTQDSTEKSFTVWDVVKITEAGRDKGLKSDSEPAHFSAVEDLWNKLRKPRVERDRTVRKRLIWLKSNEEDNKTLCLAASHDDEESAISTFVQRNTDAKQFFRDETSMFLNTWETELHLSFYQLCPDESTSSSKDTMPNIDFVFPKSGGCTITKASFGFRFTGDFFDRFWTCHFIGPNSWPETLSSQLEVSKKFKQRKFLELYLFEQILNTLVDRTKRLFRALKKAVKLGGYGRDIFLLDYKNANYSEFIKDWEDLRQSLKHIFDELERVDDTIDRWKTREIDRGAERPRWTRYDEMQYRNDINKYTVSTNHKIQEFKSLQREIKSFEEWLKRYQEHIREEAAFRSSENIKFFTYVTVVFLPLGFASSIFSMSAVPEEDMIRRMVTTATIALMITILAIVSAPRFKSGFNQTTQKSVLSRAMKHTIKLCKDDSIVFQLNGWQVETKIGGRSATDKINGESTPPGDDKQKGRDNSHQRGGTTDTWIWLQFILIEIPVRIVFTACRKLGGGCMSTTTFFNVVLGIIVLPWGLIAVMANITIVNVVDLIVRILLLLFDTLDNFFKSGKESQNREETQSREEDLTLLEFILKPSDKLRPLKKKRDKLAMPDKKKAA